VTPKGSGAQGNGILADIRAEAERLSARALQSRIASVRWYEVPEEVGH